MKHLMDGMTVDYTYSGGMHFVVTFRDGLASYEAVGDTGGVSDANDNIPYESREIRPGLIHTIWHETDIGDLVSLVIDLEENWRRDKLSVATFLQDIDSLRVYGATEAKVAPVSSMLRPG